MPDIEEVKGAVRRAADWLEANPENHVVGNLAVNASGRPTAPNGPGATCFCALGRIAREAKIDVPVGAGYDGLRDFLAPLQIGVSQIYGLNDEGTYYAKFGRAACGAGQDRGNPAVIPFLREISR